MSAILESLNAFSAAGLIAVLNTLWLAFAVAAVIWLALRLTPRVNAATRHAIWWAVLALVVILPLAALLPRPVPSVLPPARTETQIPARGLPSSAIRPLSETRADVPAPSPISVPLNTLYPRAAAEPRLRIPIEFHPGNWQSSLLFLWLTVSCVLLARIVQSYLHLCGLRKRARPAGGELVLRFEQRRRESRTARDPQLLVSDEVISPLAAGFLHPVIVLPDVLLKEISGPELDYVLLHELAHVARRDDWTNLMGRLVSVVFAFHPVTAWVLHRIEREREIACDDWVVAATGSAVGYAATLARLFEFCCSRRRELLATGMAHRSSNLRERIEILLRPRLHFSAGASLPRIALCVAVCLALLSFGVRMPGWIAFARDTPVAAAYAPAGPQTQIPAARMAPASEASPVAVPRYAATLAPAYRTQSSATPAAIPADQDKTWRHEWKLTRQDSSSSRVQLSLISRDDDGNNRMNTEDVPISSLDGFSLSALDQDGPVKFEYVRDSGRILCEGRVTGGRASGTFTVVLNPSFVSALQNMGYAAPHDDEAFSLVTSDVTLGYARAIRDTGLTSSVSDLIDLRNHGVGADYVRAVREEGFTDLTASDISDLRDHGVEPGYLKAIKAAGPSLSIDAIDSLYDHCVRADYYKSITATAPQLSIEQIDSLFDHGVEPNSYRGFASVEPRPSIEEIDSLRDHGVKPEYYGSMKSVDPNLSIMEIDSLRDHGVEPEFYRGIKAADSAVTIEEINRLRDHGVEPNYLREIRDLPDGFSISDISELRDHGITARYIQNLHDMGMKSLTAAQIVHLHDSN
jgi:beta-lactamase regulating signal transducer with metallopeptidase domain